MCLLRACSYSRFLVNSRTAIAGAIIGLLLAFYNSKNMNLNVALFFFKMCSHIFQ